MFKDFNHLKIKKTDVKAVVWTRTFTITVDSRQC